MNNNDLANKIRALPVSLHRNQRMVSLADVLGIVNEPMPERTLAELPMNRVPYAAYEGAPSIDLPDALYRDARPAEQEATDEPNAPKVARRRAETGDR